MPQTQSTKARPHTTEEEFQDVVNDLLSNFDEVINKQGNSPRESPIKSRKRPERFTVFFYLLYNEILFDLVA